MLVPVRESRSSCVDRLTSPALWLCVGWVRYMVDSNTFYAGAFTVCAFVAGQVLNWVFEPAYSYNRRDEQQNEAELFNPASYAVGQRVDLSIVIPAFREEARLGVMMDRTLEWMEQWAVTKELTYEIVVVDDGSPDNTAAVAKEYMAKSDRVRLFKLGENVGKGGALRRGVRISRGSYILIADADAATEIADLPKLFDRVVAFEEDGHVSALAVGSRAHLRDSSVEVRAWYRTVLMYGFHVAVRLLCSSHIKDTQCGFKLFTRKAAKHLFSSLHLERWAFDVEIIYLSEMLDYPIAEEDVRWEEVPGSKLIETKWDVVTTSLTMARDMLCVRLCYMLGIWAPRASTA